jgi:transcriptional antiterminator NusG
MSKNWYIVHTYTGYEKKILRTVNQMLEAGELDSNVITDVKVPEEEVVEIKDGKKKSKKNMILPGYIMMEMDLPELGWKDMCGKIRHIQGVTGFVGTSPSEKPRPISADEAKNLLLKAGEIKGDKNIKIKQNYAVGDQVKITDGPFANFNGSVEEVDATKGKLHVMVQIFGRSTPVEVDLLQVEKLI